MRYRSSRILWFVLPLLAAGCQDIDPYRAEYKWQPEGVVQGDMAAMVANPTDLIHGRGRDYSDGGRASAAIGVWTKTGPGVGSGLSNSVGNGGSGGGSGGGSSGGGS